MSWSGFWSPCCHATCRGVNRECFNYLVTGVPHIPFAVSSLWPWFHICSTRKTTSTSITITSSQPTFQNLHLLLSYTRSENILNISIIDWCLKLYMVSIYKVFLTWREMHDFGSRNGRFIRAKLIILSHGQQTLLLIEKVPKWTTGLLYLRYIYCALIN